MISIREEITIASPPEAVWPILSDPATVASCIPGAALIKAGGDGKYQGTMRVKFGPTVAQFRGEATLAYDHAARRCTIEGRGIDGRGASRANASGVAEVSGTDATLLKVEGNFTVTGPLETFANAGGVHIARAILAEFADNVAKLVAEQEAVSPAPQPSPLPAGEERESADAFSPRPVYGEREGPAPKAWEGEGQAAPTPRASAAELSGGKILWRAFLSWLRQVFSRKRETG
jgi:carbon monoxide dehydrogenase subunit G